MHELMINLCDVSNLWNRLNITSVAIRDHFMVHHEEFVHTLVGPVL